MNIEYIKINTIITGEVVATNDVTKNSPTSVICLPLTEDSSNSSNSSNYLLTYLLLTQCTYNNVHHNVL